MKKRFLSLFLVVLLVLSSALLMPGCTNGKTTTVTTTPSSSASETEPETTPAPTEPETEAPITINIVAIGDMLMHAGVSTPALQADGTYNYDYVFKNIKNQVSSASLAVVNNEVIFGGNAKGNVGYPCFNVRTELGDAEVNAGFDVILSATNHTMDQSTGVWDRTTGIANTLDFWKKYPQVSLLGIHDSAEEANNITVRDVDGIRVALLNYTYGTNGIQVPAGYEYMVDLLTEENKGKIANDIQRAKTMADFVVVFPHWGVEYVLEANDNQKAWAQFFADNGVDLIIGTHPHVLQPVEWYKGVNGNNTLVYYSLGNYISIQYYTFNMLGGMADVEITKDSTGTYISDYNMEFLITHYINSRLDVQTYYLSQYTNELAAVHGIQNEPDEEYQWINTQYPFNVESMTALAKQVCPQFFPGGNKVMPERNTTN